MKMTNKAEFYKIIYDQALDVHPCAVGKYENGAGYIMHWKLRNGELFGITRNLDSFKDNPNDFYQVSNKFIKKESSHA